MATPDERVVVCSRQLDVTKMERTHRIANLRGLRDRTGNNAKQITKQASAARLQPPKISRRSHRLTIESARSVSVADVHRILVGALFRIFWG